MTMSAVCVEKNINALVSVQKEQRERINNLNEKVLRLENLTAQQTQDIAELRQVVNIMKYKGTGASVA